MIIDCNWAQSYWASKGHPLSLLAHSAIHTTDQTHCTSRFGTDVNVSQTLTVPPRPYFHCQQKSFTFMSHAVQWFDCHVPFPFSAPLPWANRLRTFSCFPQQTSVFSFCNAFFLFISFNNLNSKLLLFPDCCALICFPFSLALPSVQLHLVLIHLLISCLPCLVVCLPTFKYLNRQCLCVGVIQWHNKAFKHGREREIAVGSQVEWSHIGTGE